MIGSVEVQLLEPAPDRAVVAILHAPEILAHVLRLPRRIAGDLRDVVPVLVVRVDQIIALWAVQPPSVPARGYRYVVFGMKVLVALLLRRVRRSGARKSPTASRRSPTPAGERREPCTLRAGGCSPELQPDRLPLRGATLCDPPRPDCAATVPPPAPEPTTMYSYDGSRRCPTHPGSTSWPPPLLRRSSDTR